MEGEKGEGSAVQPQNFAWPGPMIKLLNPPRRDLCDPPSSPVPVPNLQSAPFISAGPSSVLFQAWSVRHESLQCNRTNEQTGVCKQPLCPSNTVADDSSQTRILRTVDGDTPTCRVETAISSTISYLSLSPLLHRCRNFPSRLR